MSDGCLVLTGAGCSMDAGLAGTYALTTRMDEILARPEGHPIHRATPDVVQRFRYVCSVLAMSKARNGGSPFAPLNIEEVFSAVQLLAERRTLEVAPFVGHWLDGVDELGIGLMERQESDALLRRIGDYLKSGAKPANERWEVIEGFRDDFERCVRALAGGSGHGYRDLAYWMTRTLVDALMIPDPPQVDYLKPLVSAATSRDCRCLVTLNYDLSLEMACEAGGIRWETGIAPGGGFSISRLEQATREHLEDRSAPVPLVKLHGSISWTHAEANGFRLTEYPWNGDLSSLSPMLVFGQREKLRHDGPFLDLLSEFRRALDDSDRILVIGYSFRDRHVNHYLGEWLRADDQRVIIVLSPGEVPVDPGFDPFCSQLGSAYRDRLRHVPATAREGVYEALELAHLA
jgi:hypothetical protein